MHQTPWKYAHSSSLDAKQLKVLMETHWKQKNRRKTQRCLNWMSWNSNHSIGWTDTLISTFVRWVLRLEFSKVTIGWTDDPSIGSSGDLGFGNSKDWSSVASALDDLTPWPAVHLTPSFKLDRETPRIWIQHRMIRRFMNISAVHPTPVFELHSTAPSGCSSAADSTAHRCNVWVTWVQRLFHCLWGTGWSDACVRGTHQFIWQYYFSVKPFQRLAEDHVWFTDRWIVASWCDEWLTTLCGLILG
jgi:hypothetical protein